MFIIIKKNFGYRAEKSKIFMEKEVYQIIGTAPDEKFSVMKVAFIISLVEVWTTNEKVKMSTDEVDIMGNKIIMTISDTKTNRKINFAVVCNSDNDSVTLFEKILSFNHLIYIEETIYIL